MEPEAYQALKRLEADHWWFRGARAVYRTLLDIGVGKLHREFRLLEVGSGTGGNLAWLGD